MINKGNGVKNVKVRDYLYESIPEILNRNPFFVKVYGKKFAEKKIKSKLVTVYTNAEPQKSNC